MSKNVYRFDLVAVKPVKGQPGILMLSRTTYADSISAAVKTVRQEVEGSGWVVLQAEDYRRSVRRAREEAEEALENGDINA
jgi:hypothetical protein